MWTPFSRLCQISFIQYANGRIWIPDSEKWASEKLVQFSNSALKLTDIKWFWKPIYVPSTLFVKSINLETVIQTVQKFGFQVFSQKFGEDFLVLDVAKNTFVSFDSS